MGERKAPLLRPEKLLGLFYYATRGPGSNDRTSFRETRGTPADARCGEVGVGEKDGSLPVAPSGFFWTVPAAHLRARAVQAPLLPRFPPEKWEGQRLESACWEAGGEAGESLGFPEVGGGGSGPDSHPTRGRAALRSPSRPFVLQCPGRAPSPPPPSPDLLRWGRGVGAQSQQLVLPGVSGVSHGTRLPSRGDQGAAVLAMHRRRPSAQESRAPALRVRKLRAPVAPERPGGEATPSSEATPRSSLLPGSRAARSARPTPSSRRQPNGKEHHRPPGETRGRMEGGAVAPGGVLQ